MQDDQDQPLISVVVKCLNEAANLRRCLNSLTAEILDRGYDAEIILADSISTDGSTEIAKEFDVTIVQLCDPADRGCGAVGHLGWQFVRSRFLLQVDGDHELLPGFLETALAAMQQDDRLGAVGGRVEEMSDAIEFWERQARPNPARRPGLVDHVPSCGLYRTAAVRDAGYFTDRNLHSYEEFELGLRLRARGWNLRRPDIPCVRHYGHRDAALELLVRRWRTRFLLGYGELLRATWGQTYFWKALKPCRLALMVVLCWSILLGLAVGTVFARDHYLFGVLSLCIAAVLLSFAAMLLRKKSLQRAAYAWLALQFSAAGLVVGLFSVRTVPAMPLPTRVLRDVRTGKAGVKPTRWVGASSE